MRRSTTNGNLPASKTALARLIQDGLKEYAKGKGIDANCVEIERERLHVLQVDRGDWGEGLVVYWYEPAWNFCVTKYLVHVVQCDNPFHLLPIVNYDPASIYVEDRATLTFTPSLERKNKKAAKKSPRVPGEH